MEYLNTLHGSLAGAAKRCCFLLGDSSLDNKHWLFDERRSKASQMSAAGVTAAACNGYERVLRPPRSVRDVAYWMNHLAERRAGPGALLTFNAAVETSRIADRSGGLLPQDEWAASAVAPGDAAVLSLGGNDIALAPSLRTMWNMLTLTSSPMGLIRSGWAPGMGYFVKMFHGRIEQLLRRMFPEGAPQPSTIAVCM